MGIPKQATQEDKLRSVRHIHPAGSRFTRASVKSCDVQAIGNDPAGQETWRLSFKEYPSKNKINERVFQKPRELEHGVPGDKETRPGKALESGEDGLRAL